MNKKYTVLLSTIFALVIILTLTILIKDKGVLKTRVSKLKGTIANIEIKNGENESIKIVNENGEWRVNTNYNIDRKVIEDIISSIEKIEINTLVSKPTDEMLEKYNLKGNAILVIASDTNSKVLRKIIIGERAPLSYDIYGQIDDDKNIYLLTSNLNLYDIFSQPLDKIVSKSVINFLSYDVAMIKVRDFNDKEYSIKKNVITNNPPITNANGIVVEREEYWLNQNNIKIESYDSLNIYDLFDLQADVVNDKIVKTSDKPLYTISVASFATNTIEKIYSIFSKDEKDLYRITVEKENLNYYINEGRYSRITNAIEFIKNPKVKN